VLGPGHVRAIVGLRLIRPHQAVSGLIIVRSRRRSDHPESQEATVQTAQASGNTGSDHRHVAAPHMPDPVVHEKLSRPFQDGQHQIGSGAVGREFPPGLEIDEHHPKEVFSERRRPFLHDWE
jgi:hypothetical protein